MRSFTKNVSLLSIFLTCVLLMPSLAFTQENEKPQVFPSAEETLIVVAQDVQEDMRTSGRSVLVIDARTAEEEGYTTVGEVLRAYSDVNIIPAGELPGSTTSVFIRGGNSTYVQVLVDDVPINQIGGYFDFASLPLANIERIEVLKGAGSSIYGSEAVAGVIRIITRKGSDQEHIFRLRGAGGNYNSYLGQLDAMGTLGKSIRYSLTVEGFWSDRQLPVNDEFQRQSAHITLSGGKRSNWAVRYRFIRSEVHFPTSFAGDKYDIPDPQQFQRTREHIASFEWNVPLSSWESHLSIGYYRILYHFEDPDDGPVIDPFGSYWSDMVNERLLGRAYLSRQLGQHRIRFGLEYRAETGKDKNLYSPEYTSYKRNTFAVFATEDFETANKRFGFAAGVRYEHHSDYAGVLSPEINVSYWITQSVKIRGSAGFGFKSPAFYQVHGLGQFVTGNTDLKPEHSITADAGIDFFYSAGSFSITFFNHTYRDIILFINQSDPSLPDFQNIQSAQARGIEAELNLHSGPWRSRLSYTYTFTKAGTTQIVDAFQQEYISGKPLLRRPQHRAVLSLGFHKPRYRLEADIIYQGKRWDLDWRNFIPQRTEMPAYVRVDFTARFRFSDTFALYANVINLFDTEYEEIFGYTGQRRTLLAGLDIAL